VKPKNENWIESGWVSKEGFGRFFLHIYLSISILVSQKVKCFKDQMLRLVVHTAMK